MNKKLLFPGGEPDINIDDLLRDPIANRAALFGLLQGLAPGTNCVVSGAINIIGIFAANTDGYVWLDGELLQMDAASNTTVAPELWEVQKEVTYDSLGDKTFNNSTPRQTWQKNRAKLVQVGSITGQNAATIPTLLEVLESDVNDRIDSVLTKIDNLNTKVFSIGDWDMVANQSKQIDITSSGITLSKIVNVPAVIFNDPGKLAFGAVGPRDIVEGGSVRVVQSGEPSYLILLNRDSGGAFDDTTYSDTGYNRGYVKIEYID